MHSLRHALCVQAIGVVSAVGPQYVKEYEEKQLQRFDDDFIALSQRVESKANNIGQETSTPLAKLITELQMTNYGRWLVVLDNSHVIVNTEKEARRVAAEQPGSQGCLLRGILAPHFTGSYAIRCGGSSTGGSSKCRGSRCQGSTSRMNTSNITAS